MSISFFYQNLQKIYGFFGVLRDGVTFFLSVCYIKVVDRSCLFKILLQISSLYIRYNIVVTSIFEKALFFMSHF